MTQYTKEYLFELLRDNSVSLDDVPDSCFYEYEVDGMMFNQIKFADPECVDLIVQGYIYKVSQRLIYEHLRATKEKDCMPAVGEEVYPADDDPKNHEDTNGDNPPPHPATEENVIEVTHAQDLHGVDGLEEVLVGGDLPMNLVFLY